MTKGPEVTRFERYLDGASPGQVRADAAEWRRARVILDAVAQGLSSARARVEELGTSETVEAIRAHFGASAESMLTRSRLIKDADAALRSVADELDDAAIALASLGGLGAKPAAHVSTLPTTAQPTPEEVEADAQARARANAAREQWQAAYDAQEATAARWTTRLDTTFLDAIPPMQAIHGLPDPTVPPSTPPTAPPSSPPAGAGAPPTSSSPSGQAHATLAPTDPVTTGTRPTPTGTTTTTTTSTTTTPTTTSVSTPTSVPTDGPTSGPTTSVIGESQSGISPTPPSGAPVGGGAGLGPGTVAGGGGTSTSSTVAPGAGALAAGAGTRPTSTGGTVRSAGAGAVRPIGASGRSAGSSALGRPASTGSPAAARAGGQAVRGGGQGGRSGAAGGAGRAGAPGQAGGRSGRRGRDDSSNRDSLVFGQDWLGDEDVAPGVLD